MKIWGYSTHIDLYNCDPISIRSQIDIIKYVQELCALIQMNMYGGCILNHFGNDEKVKGYTFVQLIETSLISGHLVELTNDAHIDIFSCKHYNQNEAHEFSVYYFKAQKSKLQVLER